jgi:hypothetical protein
MKKMFLIFIGSAMLIALPSSCKKTASDERDIFIGTWSGHLYFERIGTEYFTTEEITKSATDKTQIIIKTNGNSSSSRTATVNGSSYTYQNFNSTLGISGNYDGSGSISGDAIQESGTITSDNPVFPGDLGGWFRTLTRQ